MPERLVHEVLGGALYLDAPRVDVIDPGPLPITRPHDSLQADVR